jgi:hypothetical protein
VRTRIFHIPFIHDDLIVGSKPVALCNNKSHFVVFDGFFYIYFAHTTGWPLLKISQQSTLTEIQHKISTDDSWLGIIQQTAYRRVKDIFAAAR